MTLTREFISQLAPSELENYRSSRYRADDQAIDLASLGPTDRELVVWMYETLRELDHVVGGKEILADPAPLLAFVGRHDVTELVGRIRRIGAEAGNDERLAEVFHDIRGGALSAVTTQLSRLGRVPYRTELARSLYIVTRDHMKMMRNVIKDLDPAERERDVAFRDHSLGDLAGAFREFTGDVRDERVVVNVDCQDDAVIAESCVEFGAIDRVAYNLLNNAVRHTEQPVIDAWLIRLERDLRIAFANSISAAQRALLEPRMAADPSALFGDFSTTESGYGLRIVAELVGHAYGVASVARLTAGGYVGAKLVGDGFVTWFHWPSSDHH